MNMTRFFQLLLDATLKGCIDWYRVGNIQAPFLLGHGHLDHFEAVIRNFDFSFSVDKSIGRDNFVISFEVHDRSTIASCRVATNVDVALVQMAEDIVTATYLSIRKDWMFSHAPVSYEDYYGIHGTRNTVQTQEQIGFGDGWYFHG